MDDPDREPTAAIKVDVFPLTLTRVPCLPLDRLPASPFTHLLAADQAMQAHSRDITQAGRDLAMRIGTQLPSFPSGQRRWLLDLRRGLFNCRVPCGDAWEAAIALLGSSLASDVRGWVEQVREYEEEKAESIRAWSAAVEEAAAQLTDLSCRSAVAVALATHHPHMANPANPPKSGDTTSSRNARRRRTLWALIWRAALRPTPLGLYCSVGFGEFASPPTAFSIEERDLVDTGYVERMVALTAQLAYRRGVLKHVEVALAGALARRFANGRANWFAYDELGVARPIASVFLDLLEKLWQHGGAMNGSHVLDNGVRTHVVGDAVARGWILLRWPGDGLDQREQRPSHLAQVLTIAAFTEAAVTPLLAGAPRQITKVTASAPEAASYPRFQITADSSLGSIAHIPLELRDGMVADAAWWGAGLVEDHPTPSRRATRILLDVLFGSTRIRFMHLVRALSQLADAAGLATNSAAHPAQIAAALGLLDDYRPNPFDAIAGDALRSGLATVTMDCDSGSLVGVRDTRRVALRVRAIDRPGAPGSALLTRFGGDRGSFLPRYLNLPSARVCGAPAKFKQWLARHPDLVDLDVGAPTGIDCRPRLVRRVPGPQAGRTQEDLSLDEIFIEPRDLHDVALLDRSGAPVDPVYFGVLGPVQLPIPFQLLLTLGSPARSGLELVIEALNLSLRAVADKSGPWTRLPEIWLTPRLQLMPASGVLNCAALAEFTDDGDRSMFLQFHRRMSRAEIPAGRVAVRNFSGPAEPQVVDLRYPEGVALLVRRALKSSGRTLLVSTVDDPPVDPSGQRYCVEYAVELEVSPAQSCR